MAQASISSRSVCCQRIPMRTPGPVDLGRPRAFPLTRIRLGMISVSTKSTCCRKRPLLAFRAQSHRNVELSRAAQTRLFRPRDCSLDSSLKTAPRNSHVSPDETSTLFGMTPERTRSRIQAGTFPCGRGLITNRVLYSMSLGGKHFSIIVFQRCLKLKEKFARLLIRYQKSLRHSEIGMNPEF